MAEARPRLDLVTPTRVSSSGLRVVASLLFLSVLAFFAVSAYHHIAQSFQLLSTDLSKAALRLEAQEELGMVDAVFDTLIYEYIKEWGFFHPADLEAVTRFELWMALGIGILNALLVLFALTTRQKKTLWLFLMALWVLALTTAFLLANPAILGSAEGEMACNCTGLEMLDFNNIWLEVARNGAMIVILLWLAFAWSTPVKGQTDNG